MSYLGALSAVYTSFQLCLLVALHNKVPFSTQTDNEQFICYSIDIHFC